MSMKERPGFRDWFGEGAFVNSDGRPTVFYHGTDTGADFNIFARTDEASIGFHFGDIATAECRIDLMTSSAVASNPTYAVTSSAQSRASRPSRSVHWLKKSRSTIWRRKSDFGVLDIGFFLVGCPCGKNRRKEQ